MHDTIRILRLVIGTAFSLLAVTSNAGSENVLLSALYPEQGHVLARLFEYQGRGGETPIACGGSTGQFEVVDLLGRNGQPVTSPLSLKPWQIRTVRIEVGR